MTTIVSTTDLTRRYGEGAAAVDALAGVTVEIARGKFTAIMGASGSGKSTLMHLMAGLDTPTSGSVELDGVDLGDLDDKHLTELRRDRVGFVFQAFNLLPGADRRGEPRAAADDRRAQAGRGLARVARRRGRARRSPARTARPSCRAASSSASPSRARSSPSPPWSSPTSPPATSTRHRSAEVMGLLRRAVDEFGQTVVMVTHDAAAAAYADRLIVLADGRVAQDTDAGSADEILDVMKAVAS